MAKPVKKIVIVGGGTAGWLTAAIIAAKHKARLSSGFSVTLVESPNTPMIGVGKGAWPTLCAILARIDRSLRLLRGGVQAGHPLRRLARAQAISWPLF